MTTKHLVYTALMTAIICILGLVPSVPLPFMPVPIVLQNIGIFLAGIILGRKLGTTSVIVFLLLVATGLPVLSGGRGGIGVFAGPSAGFLFLYPVVAYIMGFIIHIPISKAFILSFTFMPGDIIKAIIASLIGAAILNHSRFKTLIQ